MNRAEIIEKLKEILLSADERNRAVVENCTEDSNLMTDFGMTSVGMLYIVIAIEEMFNIRMDDVSFGEFRTVGDVADYIEKKLGK